MPDITPFNPSVLQMLQGYFTKTGGLTVPFIQEIFLIECHVAGTSYVDIDEIEPTLEPGDIFIFNREPGNPHDGLAIVISDKSGNKLGYVPRSKNEILARLMDAGKIIFGRMEKKEWYGEWLKLTIRIYMKDL